MTFAAPAASEPPTSTIATRPIDGTPPDATIMAGTVVTSRSSTMRGLVSETYALMRSAREATTGCSSSLTGTSVTVTRSPSERAEYHRTTPRGGAGPGQRTPGYFGVADGEGLARRYVTRNSSIAARTEAAAGESAATNWMPCWGAGTTRSWRRSAGVASLIAFAYTS